MISGIFTIADLRKVVRMFLQIGEEHANMFKRFKVIGEDMTYAFTELMK